MRLGELVAGGGGVGRDDDPQAGAGGGNVAGHGILEGHGLVSGEAESFERGEVEIRLGFSKRDVFAAEHGVEEWQQAAEGELALDVVVAGIGSDGETQSGGAGLGEQGGDAGTDGGGGHQGAGQSAVTALEGGFVAGGRIGFPDVGCDIDVTDQGVQHLGARREAIFAVDGLPGVDDRGFGVHDETVEIKDKSAQRHVGTVEGKGGGASHGGSFVFSEQGTKKARRVRAGRG